MAFVSNTSSGCPCEPHPMYPCYRPVNNYYDEDREADFITQSKCCAAIKQGVFSSTSNYSASKKEEIMEMMNIESKVKNNATEQLSDDSLSDKTVSVHEDVDDTKDYCNNEPSMRKEKIEGKSAKTIDKSKNGTEIISKECKQSPKRTIKENSKICSNAAGSKEAGSNWAGCNGAGSKGIGSKGFSSNRAGSYGVGSNRGCSNRVGSYVVGSNRGCSNKVGSTGDGSKGVGSNRGSSKGDGGCGSRQTSGGKVLSKESSVPVVECFTVDAPEFKVPCKKVIKCVCSKNKKAGSNDFPESCNDVKKEKKSKSKKRCPKNSGTKCPPNEGHGELSMSGMIADKWCEECPGDDSNFHEVPPGKMCPTRPLDLNKTLDFCPPNPEIVPKKKKKCFKPDANCKINLYRIWKKYAERCYNRYSTTYYEPEVKEEVENEPQNYTFEYNTEQRKKIEPIQLDILRKMRELQELQEDVIKISRKPFGKDMIPIVTNMRLPFMKEDTRLYVMVHSMSRNAQMKRQLEREKHTKELEERFYDLYSKVKLLEKHLEEATNEAKKEGEKEKELQEQKVMEEQKGETKEDKPACFAPPPINYVPPVTCCFKLCQKEMSKNSSCPPCQKEMSKNSLCTPFQKEMSRNSSCPPAAPNKHQVFYSLVNPVLKKSLHSSSKKSSTLDILKDLKPQNSNFSMFKDGKNLRGFISTSSSCTSQKDKLPISNQDSLDSDFQSIKLYKDQKPLHNTDVKVITSTTTCEQL